MAQRVPCLFACAVLLTALRAAHAGEFAAPLMPAAPTLDGRIDPAEWAGAIRLDGLMGEQTLERRAARVWVGATKTHLYVAIWSQLPAEGSILADVKRDSENLVFDDAVEVWIDPTPGAERGKRYQMLANSIGNRWFKAHSYGGVPDDPAWRCDWQVANGLHDGAWHCEVAIPIASVSPDRADSTGAWAINVCRDWKQEWAWASFSGNAYKPVDRFTFTAAPGLAASSELRGDVFAGEVQAVLVLRNPGAAPATVRAEVHLLRDVMPEAVERQTVRVGPGETREVAVKVSDQATKSYTLTMRATSEDGATVLLDRKLAWRAAPPWKWTVAKKVVPPLDLQFAYYPYANRLRLLIDTSNLPKGARVETVTATVRKKGGEVVKSVRCDPVQPDGKREVSLSLPPLSGEYEVAVKATGPKVPEAEVVRTFERRAFPWEHTKLGRSSTVYRPFTPIKATGNHLSTVLREHTLGSTGLWTQVTARGEALLAGSMRLESDLGRATGSALRFQRRADNEAVAQSNWEAGALSADLTTTWDYDGTMRVDMMLQPTHGKTVGKLDLVIPMRADQATHYHAMGDGIRNTLYGKVPAGDGTVWTSKLVQANDLPANFCTYLYVGTPVRGLCWFAENDKGWGWDPKTPNVELVRKPGVVEIRVHLINRPEVIAKARTITFGLLAAPVKPRIPTDWRHKWRRENWSLLGTDINWLALGDCGSVYPAGQDMVLWEMIKRGNKERLTDADIQKVVERGKPYFAPYGEERVQTFANHARYNLTSRYGTNMVFYYNRASYQAAPEFETFKDEWSLTDYRGIGKGNGIGEIKIVPSESYIDHALWWYAKSFDIGGNRGVYWDNWFFAGSYNTEMTAAYKREDGTVVPSTGIWGLRELAKRTFQMMNERKMLPVTMPHMTSTAILPMLSFATVQYDWEWKYSEGDVQDRFTRDYILMVTNGELAGTWPVLLGDQGPQAEDPHVARTFAAVALLHELDCGYPAWSKAGQAQIALLKPIDDILKQPGVREHRYWDDEPAPARTADADLPAICYWVPGKEAVIGVVSYADGERNAKVTVDLARLGLPASAELLDAETGQEVAWSGGSISFALKKHDVRMLRVLPR